LIAIKGNVRLMQQPRRRRWIFFLALTLGILVWWGLGWYFSPRPLYTLRFPGPADWIKTIRIGIHPNPYHLYVRPLDPFGHFFLVFSEPPPIKGQITSPAYQVFDFRTGKMLSRHQFDETEQNEIDIDDVFKGWNHDEFDHHLSDPEGVRYLQLRDRNASKRPPTRLVAWNLASDHKNLLHTFQNARSLTICRDGNTMLEQNNLQPFFIPTLLPSPAPWSQALTSLFFLEDGRGDLDEVSAVLVTVRLLPALQVKYQTVLPPLKPSQRPFLSYDGRWMVLHQLEDNKIRIYDLVDGEIHPAATPRDFQVDSNRPVSIGHDIFRVEAKCRNQEDLQFKYLHLPSGRWLELDNEFFHDVEPPSQDHAQPRKLLSYGGLSHANHYAVWELPRDGSVKFVAQVKDVGEIPTLNNCLIPGSTQFAFSCFVRKEVPDWLEDIFRKIGPLRDWLEKVDREFVVKDFGSGRTLFRRTLCDVNDDCEFHATRAGNYLIYTQLMADHHAVSVFALPLPDFSPWWSRSVGVVTFLLVWLLLRKLFGRRD
jgi:hypothetical protein